MLPSALIRTGHTFLRRYSHVNWALCDQVMVSGCNFLTTVIFARILGIDEFGHFSLLWFAMMIVNSIHVSLLVSPMMTLGPKKDLERQDAFFSAMLAMQIISILVVSLIVWGGSRALEITFGVLALNGLATPLTAATVAFFSREFFRRYFFARCRPSVAFLNDGLGYAVQFVLILALSNLPTASSAQALWAIAAGALVSSLAGVPRIRLRNFELGTLRQVINECWRFSKWILATAGVTTTVHYFYMLIASVLLGTAVVGGLRATQNLMQATHVLLLALENVVPVRAAVHFRDRGILGLKAFLIRTAWTLGLASAAIALVAALAPQFWLELVYGEDYGDFGVVLQIFAIQSLLIATGFVLRSGLRTIERTREVFLAQVCNSGSAIVIAYPMMALLGVVGAALGHLPANLLYLYVMWTALRRAFGSEEERECYQKVKR